MDDILKWCSNPRAREQITSHRKRIAALLDRGVNILCPESVEVGPEIDLERIAPDVTIHVGTKLRGARTALGPGVELGREAPVALEDCVLGHGVVLDGGYYQGVTMLDGANTRSAAHFREGTLLEEQASAAHCVGLKQTILFPFVTLGSLINFCDCLMAGGTSRKDHSEVGSGYIHFNFTPRGDKATPSLFGDVPRGVFLDQPRIFLGGLAASVGPLEVGYGVFRGPGFVYRRDVREATFQLGEKTRTLQMEFDPKVLTGVGAKVRKNFRYIGHLVALWQWYVHVRRMFDGAGRELFYREARYTVEGAIGERIKQLDKLVGLIPESLERLRLQGAGARTLEDQSGFLERWPVIKAVLEGYPSFNGDTPSRDLLLNGLTSLAGPGRYLEAVRAIDPSARQSGARWLESIVTAAVNDAEGALVTSQ